MKKIKKAFAAVIGAIGMAFLCASIAGAQVTAPTIPLSSGNLNTSLGPISITSGQLSFSAWPPVTYNQVFALAAAPPTGTCLPQQIFTIVTTSQHVLPLADPFTPRQFHYQLLVQRGDGEKIVRLQALAYCG